MSFFQSNLRKQIRNLPKLDKILDSVKFFHYDSLFFICVPGLHPRAEGRGARGRRGAQAALRGRRRGRNGPVLQGAEQAGHAARGGADRDTIE